MPSKKRKNVEDCTIEVADASEETNPPTPLKTRKKKKKSKTSDAGSYQPTNQEGVSIKMVPQQTKKSEGQPSGGVILEQIGSNVSHSNDAKVLTLHSFSTDDFSTRADYYSLCSFQEKEAIQVESSIHHEVPPMENFNGKFLRLKPSRQLSKAWIEPRLKALLPKALSM